MNRRIIAALLTMAIVLPAALTNCRMENTGQKPPNIVLILSDDLGYGDLHCYNAESKIPTPNIDGLSAMGLRFTDAHAPAAWCTPSRYGLLTGKYPGRIELDWREQSLIEDQQETIATVMKRNGYRTAIVGKWHLGFDNFDWDNPANNTIMHGGPVEKGFDYFFGMHASLDIPPYFFIEADKVVESPTDTVQDNASVDATTPISGAFWRGGAIAPNFEHEAVLDQLLHKAISFIDSHVKNNNRQPFFLYFPLTAPHTPWLPKARFEGKSGAGEYGDFVIQVDDIVGQLVSYLEKNNLGDNTLIIFSSDNGPVWFQRDIQKYGHNATGGLKGMKIDLWEGGSRVPFIVKWNDKIPQGTISDQLLCFTDMMATLAYIVGDTIIDTNNFDSYNMLPVFTDPEYSEPIRNELVIDKRVYRSGGWKYIDESGLGGLTQHYDPDSFYLHEAENMGELYDLNNDIREQNNLIHREESRAKKMHEMLKKSIYSN